MPAAVNEYGIRIVYTRENHYWVAEFAPFHGEHLKTTEEISILRNQGATFVICMVFSVYYLIQSSHLMQTVMFITLQT